MRSEEGFAPGKPATALEIARLDPLRQRREAVERALDGSPAVIG